MLFVCIAWNLLEMYSIELIDGVVYFITETPTVVEPLAKSYEPIEGVANFRLTCKVTGNPCPKITWYVLLFVGSVRDVL